MKIYVFGNQDSELDNKAFEVAEKLKGIDNIEFRIMKPNEDLEFMDEKQVMILDTIQGINKIEILDENDLDHLVNSPRSTVHDFDLGSQLRYLMKLGKLGKVTIIGIPQDEKIDYERIQSILRKLVAQDIHGS